jgi:hypothetical protein
VPRAAPRLDSRLLAALVRLDKPGRVIADTHRSLGTVADELGLTRPSYQQTRVVVHLVRKHKRHPGVGDVLLDIAFRVRPPEALLDVLTD